METPQRIVVVVGVGALGSHAVLLLRNQKDVSIRVVDFDRVERKNVMSQFHTAMAVGKPKVLALKAAMHTFFGLKLQDMPRKLVDDNATELLGDAFLVIDCLDNLEARALVQKTVRSKNLPCVHGALAADGAFGRVVWDEHFVADSEAGVGGATCEDGQQLPFIGLTAAYLARAAQEFLERGNKHNFQVTVGGTVRF